MGVNAQLWYSFVHNQIATFGLLGRQSVTLNIGCSHNRYNRPSEQSAKCNIGQALIMERQFEYGQEVHICFIDYSKALDCINQELLWKTLLEMGIPKHQFPIEMKQSIFKYELSQTKSNKHGLFFRKLFLRLTSLKFSNVVASAMWLKERAISSGSFPSEL